LQTLTIIREIAEFGKKIGKCERRKYRRRYNYATKKTIYLSIYLFISLSLYIYIYMYMYVHALYVIILVERSEWNLKYVS